MAESLMEDPDRKEIDKNEEISIQEEILPSSTVEDTCTVYLQEEDVGMDATEIKGKHLRRPVIYSFIMNIYLYSFIMNIYLYSFIMNMYL